MNPDRTKNNVTPTYPIDTTYLYQEGPPATSSARRWYRTTWKAAKKRMDVRLFSLGFVVSSADVYIACQSYH